MRIAMIGVRGIPAASGGAERVVEELSGELTGMGHEVLVYSRRSYVRDTAILDGARRIVTPCLPGKHLEAISHTALAVADAVARGVDLVHLHSPGPGLMSWLPALAGVPVVLTIHAPDWQRARWSAPARAALRAGLAIGSRCARAVTTVSQPLAGELSRQLGRPVVYIPNAVRTPQSLPPDHTLAMGLEPGRFALTVARIVPEKRLDLLLRTWARTGGDWPLVVVGAVQDRAYGRLCQDLAGRANVRMLGECTGDRLSALYQHCGMLVCPSELEGMSLVLLEAAASGCCILAADIPANSAALGDSIVYFRCNDQDDLSRQVERLVADPLARRKFAGRAREKARQYDWAISARQLEQVYLSAGRKEL